jgi:hypothetical protein
MRKSILFILILLLCGSLAYAQDPSTMFYKGGIADGMIAWAWSFSDNTLVENPTPSTGYSPGAAALKWGDYNQDGYQGVMIETEGEIGIDMSSIWDTDSVYFKLRAPSGLNESDPPLNVSLYDSRDTWSWDYTILYELDNFQDLNDTEWHQFSVALKDFVRHPDNMVGTDSTDIVGVAFEYFDSGMSTPFYIDEVWIGSPDISHTMTFFSGQNLGSQVWWEAWGFENIDLTLAEAEGYVEGTPAILWETSNWDWQGMGFIMNTHDMTYSFTTDTMRLKIKAPAGINNLALEWYDVYYNDTYAVARKVLDNVTWDGNWQSIEIPLSDFNIDESFDVTQVYEFGVVAADATVPERLLLDDIWLGDPGIVIDIVPPPTPENITADVSNKHYNLISWDNIETESGETYDVYGSREAIEDLESENVFVIASDVPEGEVAVHNLYYPLTEGDVSFHYAVTAMDAGGNPSEGFGTGGPFTNTGKSRPVISIEKSFNFVADGDLSEWDHIMPFTVTPDMLTESNWYGGSSETFDDSLDYTAFCYVAMDDSTLYVAFDVIDDVFSWKSTNTSSWWNDEGIEFYFGLYDQAVPHSYFQRGEEPDYRLVFRPNQLDYFNGSEAKLYDEGTDNYYFQPLGLQDYAIEARIPLSAIRAAEDAVFTPMEGYTIPFEIFCADADVTNADDVARVQFGPNPALNPWGDGPDVWTYAWIGMPTFTDIVNDIPVVVNTYHLGNNYPNPFNPSTTIEYTIAQSGRVELAVYNSLGQQVRTLVSDHQTAGQHKIEFNANDLASGIYYYKIKSRSFSQVKKMLLIK